MATATNTNGPNEKSGKPKHPFRKAVVRGMAVVFPPLLTVLIFVWVIHTTYRYVLDPVTYVAREVIVLVSSDIKTAEELNVEDRSQEIVSHDGVRYQRVDNNTFIPQTVYETVDKKPGDTRPETAEAIYRRYVELTCLRPYYTIPFILSVFILLLCLLGRFMAAGIGRFFWHRFERGINRLPLVRNVYSSVKQVSDFLFTEREIEFTRVVAVQYPRKGIWSLGFVTGESMLVIRSAANEPVLSVLMPTSPMPATGFTVTVAKSEVVDLDITVEQALQFIVSCGVVVPPRQLQQMRESTPAALPQPADSDHSAQAATSGQ